MPDKEVKKISKPVGEKELPAPNEKLLRAPTFFEKNAWLNKFGLFFLILIIVVIGVLYLKSDKRQAMKLQSTYRSAITSNTPREYLNRTRDNLQTYTSENGKFSIKYPIRYTAITDANLNNTFIITSDLLPEINTDFKLAIQYKIVPDGLTLQQLISQNPVCANNTPIAQNIAPGNIKGDDTENLAQFYIDTNCGQNIQTIVYTKNNNMLYILTLESRAKFDDIKPYADKLISTLKFLDGNPAPTCIPRPACLDSEPRCLMIESQNICPKAVAPTSNQVACTMDAMQCSDGSWVGRTGPDCKFVCPGY